MLTRITNTPREFKWGSTTLLADLEGREPSGRPEAEVWFGDHPGSPAIIPDGSGQTLADRIAGRGGGSPQGELPFLLKLLAADTPLSIQVHPSREQADDGYAREDAAGIALDAAHRNYRDANHKPEIIVALSDRFEALAGLRPLVDTRRLLDALGAGPGIQALRNALSGPDDSEALGSALRWLLTDPAPGLVPDVIEAVRYARSDEFVRELDAVRRVSLAYPGDPGTVVALLMNHVTLARGEALFVPAGVLHAHLGGLGVEVMAASDNVLRGGLTQKHVDVDELLRVAEIRPGAPSILEPATPVLGLAAFAPDVPDFQLARVTVAQGESIRLELTGPALAVATMGAVAVTAANRRRERLTPGQALFASADEGPLEVSGSGEVFVAMPGVKSQAEMSLDTV